MKRLALLLACVTLFCNAFGKQWIIFLHAEEASKNAIFGHAFASFIQEDIFQKQTKVVGTWGFYPRIKVPQAVWGTVPGELRDDWTTRRDLSFLVEVNIDEFNRCLRIKDLYKRELEYSLNGESCVNFVRDLSAAIVSLEPASPKRKFPADVVKDLKSRNAKIEEESINSFSNSIGNTTNSPDNNNSTQGNLSPFKINFKDITTSTDKTFRWFNWEKAPEGLKNAANFIHTYKNQQTSKDEILLNEILENIEMKCEVKIAAVDLNGDGIFGLAMFAEGGTWCCGSRGCSFRLYENGGLITVDLGTDETVKPAKNGVLSSANHFFPLKRNNRISVDEQDIIKKFTYKTIQ